MGLGNKRGHVHGNSVSGNHSTLVDNADIVIKKIGDSHWFESVRPGSISMASGGKPSITIRRYADATHVDTLKIIFRNSGSVQDIFIHVRDLETNLSEVINDIRSVIQKKLRGFTLYDRTQE